MLTPLVLDPQRSSQWCNSDSVSCYVFPEPMLSLVALVCALADRCWYFVFNLCAIRLLTQHFAAP